ncbi:MAG: Ig-like domain-containing protein [Propionibacteriaceae bacterium]|jgi:LPXTG-motif cell wall-anchored protein|nr:Ig-like domain-containing protein [Propionibacteriaceae bacterium]
MNPRDRRLDNESAEGRPTAYLVETRRPAWRVLTALLAGALLVTSIMTSSLGAPRANAADVAERVSTTPAAYDRIIYFTDVRWWQDNNPGDGVCSTGTQSPERNGAAVPADLQNVCTLLAAQQEANAWATKSENTGKSILITPADPTLEGSLTGVVDYAEVLRDPNGGNDNNTFGVIKDNTAITITSSTGIPSTGKNPSTGATRGVALNYADPGWNGEVEDGRMMATIGGRNAGGGIGDPSMLLLFTAANLTVDFQNRVGFYIDGDYCSGNLTGTCASIIGFNGVNQTFQNFGTAASALDGLFMSNSENDVVIGSSARNITIRNGYTGNSPSPQGASARYANERAVTIIGGADNVLVDNVQVDSLATAGIAFAANASDPTIPSRNIVIQNSLFTQAAQISSNNTAWACMKGIQAVGAVDAGGWDYGSNVATPIENLTITNNTFEDFCYYGDSREENGYGNGINELNNPIRLEMVKLSGTNSIVGNTFSQTTRNPLWRQNAWYTDDSGTIILSNNTAPLLIANNVFRNLTDADPLYPAVYLRARGGGIDGPINNVTIQDNDFGDWGDANQGSVIRAIGSNDNQITYLAQRNIMPAVGGTVAAEYENTMTARSNGLNGLRNPISNEANANNNIKVAYPSDATLADGRMTFTVNAPEGGVGNEPTYPISVDVFAGSETGAMATYAGRVTVASADAYPVTASLPYDAGAGAIRFQVVDATGRSSQISRTTPLTGEDDSAPMIWVARQAAQEETTESRRIFFTVITSEPVTELAPEMFVNAGTAGTFNPRFTELVADTNSPDNTRWTLTVGVDTAGTLVPEVAAGAIVDATGHTNNGPSNTEGTDNPYDQTDPTRYVPATLVGADPASTVGLGYPVDAVRGVFDTVVYSPPIHWNAASAAELVGTITEPDEGGYLPVVITNKDGFPTVSPIAYLFLETTYGPLTPDPKAEPWVTPQTSISAPAAASDMATMIPNLPGLGEIDPYGSTGDATTQTSITPIVIGQDVTFDGFDNLVVDGTREFTVTARVISTDENYDGLLLRTLDEAEETAVMRVVDNDAPVLGTITTTVDEARGDGIDTDTVVIDVTNADGEPVSNAHIALTLPEKVRAATTTPGTISGQDIAAATGDDGRVTLTLTSIYGDTFPIAATAGTYADGSDGVAIGEGTDVTFLQQPIDAARSVYTVGEEQVVANGEATIGLTVTALTAAGVPATGGADQLTAAADPASGVTFSAFTEPDPLNQPGVYTATVSSTASGEKVVEILASGETMPLAEDGNDTATFLVGEVAPGQANVTIDNDTAITADGEAAHVVTVTLADAFGNAATGHADALSATEEPSDGVTISAFTEPDPTNEPGTYEAEVASTVAGDKTVTVAFSGTALAPAVVARYAAGPVDLEAETTTFEVGPAGPLTANGEAAYTGTATITDAFGNPVEGVEVVFAGPTEIGVAPATATTDENGVATTAFTSTTAGTFAVTATVTGQGGASDGQVGQPVDITFEHGPASAGSSRLTVSNDRVVAVGSGEHHDASVEVLDAFGNPVTGAAVTFLVDGTAIDLVTSENGVAATTIDETTAGTYSVSAEIDGVQVEDSPQDIEFVAGTPSAQRSTLTVTPDGTGPIIAGEDGWIAEVVVRDAWDNPVTGAVVDFQVEAGAILSALTDTTDDEGRAQTRVTSMTAATYEVRARIGADEVEGSPAEVSFAAGAPDPLASSVSATSGERTADGVAYHEVTTTVRDSLGNAVAGVAVTLTPDADLTALGTPTLTTNADGIVTVRYATTVAGEHEVAVAIEAGTIDGSPVSLLYVAGAPSVLRSSLTVEPATSGVMIADGAHAWNAEVVVLDAFANPVRDQVVDLTVAAGATLAVETFTTDGDGRVTGTIRSATPGSYEVVARVRGAHVDGSPAEVSFAAGDPVAERSTVEATTDDRIANGSSTHTVTVTLRDAQDHPVPGAVVELDPDAALTLIGQPSMTTDAEGQVVAQYATTTAGRHEVAARIGGQAVDGSPVSLSFVPGAVSSTRSSLAVSPMSTPVGDTIEAIVRVVDDNNNPIIGESVTVTVTGSASASPATTTTGEGGVAVVTLTDEVAEDVTVTATIGRDAIRAPGSGVVVSFLDVTAPDEPVIEQANGTTMSGQAEPGSTVVLTVPGVAGQIEVPVDEKGDWSVRTPAGSLDGILTAVARDEAGNTSRPATYPFDSTSPIAPVVPPTDGSIIEGTAEPGSTVTVKDGEGNILCETIADEETGAFTCVPEPAPGPGDTIVVTATDEAGNTSPATTVVIGAGILDLVASTFVLDDAVSPATGGAARLADGTDVFWAIITLVDQAGYGMPGLTDELMVTAGADVTVTPIADQGDGVYFATLTSGVAGAYDVNAFYGEEMIGSALSASYISVTVSVAEVFQGGTMTVTGSGFEAGESVAVVLHSTPFEAGVVTADADGRATLDVVVPADFEPGAHTAVLTGERSGSAGAAFSVIEVLPLPVVLPATGSPVDGGWVAMGGFALLLGVVALLTVKRRQDEEDFAAQG